MAEVMFRCGRKTFAKNQHELSCCPLNGCKSLRQTNKTSIFLLSKTSVLMKMFIFGCYKLTENERNNLKSVPLSQFPISPYNFKALYVLLLTPSLPCKDLVMKIFLLSFFLFH